MQTEDVVSVPQVRLQSVAEQSLVEQVSNPYSQARRFVRVCRADPAQRRA